MLESEHYCTASGKYFRQIVLSLQQKSTIIENRMKHFAMNSLTLVSALVMLSFAASCGSAVKADATIDSLSGTEIFYADPTVYAENGKFYLSGTRGGNPQGFALLESTDLHNWTVARPDSMILRAGAGCFGDKGFWAPQIIKDGDKYLFTYTANEQTALAMADSLTGLYTRDAAEPIDGSEKNIDSFLFRDDDGTWYLYHVRFDHGNFLWVAEFDPATGHILPETLAPVFRNDQAWEHTGAYPSDPIMEGPTVAKLDDGKYYLFYSANHFMSPDYAVGYAVADSPKGPWTKNPANPIINKEIVGEKGSGHGDLFRDSQGDFRYVYHVHYSDSVVSPRRTRIVSLKMEKNPATGFYDITADPSTIIRPVRK